MPRTNAATPSTPAEPYGLSGCDSPVELWASKFRVNASLTSHSTLKPSESRVFLVASCAPPIDTSELTMSSL
ncbi:hypothetical protein D9M72_596200 [compost metagenome]